MLCMVKHTMVVLMLLIMLTKCWLFKLIATVPRVVMMITELGWWPAPITTCVRTGGCWLLFF